MSGNFQVGHNDLSIKIDNISKGNPEIDEKQNRSAKERGKRVPWKQCEELILLFFKASTTFDA